MRKMILTACLVLAVTFLLGPQPVQAYYQYSGTNYCNSCHTGFDSYGAVTHQAHINDYSVSCGTCHLGSNGDNPVIEDTCATCHDANLLWNYHLQFAGADPGGRICSTCHVVTPTESNSWDQVKSWYRVASMPR